MYTCSNCVYKRNCGDPSRVVPCNGRETKRDIKNNIKILKEEIKNGRVDAGKATMLINHYTVLLNRGG